MTVYSNTKQIRLNRHRNARTKLTAPNMKLQSALLCSAYISCTDKNSNSTEGETKLTRSWSPNKSLTQTAQNTVKQSHARTAPIVQQSNFDGIN